MATPIKSIPALRGKIASEFIRRAEDSLSKKHTVDFIEQANAARLIFEKAKL